MRKNLKKLFSVGLFCLSLTLFAQQKPITGQVVDSDGFPVQDAFVHLEGSDQGVYTDANGNYTIEAEPGDKVVVEFIGFNNKTITIAGADTYNVKLEKGGAIKLKNIVAVAYGTADKTTFTGSVSSVDQEQLEKVKSSDVAKSLEGAVAGLSVTNSTGQPGSGTRLRIRGIGSINASSSPLIIVDGAPYSGEINSLNSFDIQSVDVLKDAASAALYGARGANGVIIITTKKGEKGKLAVNLDMNVGVNDRGVAEYDIMKSPSKYYETFWEALYNQAIYQEKKTDVEAKAYASSKLYDALGYNIYDVSNDKIVLEDGKINPNANIKYQDRNSFNDWAGNLFSPQIRNEYNLGLSKKTEDGNVYFSLGYLNDDGYNENSFFERYSNKLSYDTKLNDWLSLNTSSLFSRTESNWTSSGSAYSNPFNWTRNIAPIYPIYVHDANGKIVMESGSEKYDFGEKVAGINEGRAYGGKTNPLATQQKDKRLNINYYLTQNAQLEAKISKNLTFSTSGTFYGNWYEYNNFLTPIGGSGKTYNGISTKSRDNVFSLNLNQILRYEKDFDDISLSALVGHESYGLRKHYLEGEKTNFVDPENSEFNNAAKIGSLDSYTRNYSVEGYFAQLTGDFENKYFFSASARRDGSSVFYKDNRWGTFWSLGGSWRLDRESFLEEATAIDVLKLKVSYGVQGNDYLYLPGSTSRSYTPYETLYAITSDGKNPGLEARYKGRKEVTWEESQNLNVGVEGSFFSSRLTFGIDYFKRKTKDLLFNLPVPSSTGFTTEPWNIGDMQNNGYEFTLGVEPIRTSKLRWSININGVHYKNEVLRLPEQFRKDGITRGSQRITEGGSIYDFYLVKYAGVDESNGDALYWIKDKATGEYEIKPSSEYDANSKQFVGSALPDLAGGFGTSLNAYGFDLSMQFSYQIGGKMLDSEYGGLMHAGIAGNNWHQDIDNRWTPQNIKTNTPRIEAENQGLVQSSDRFITDASYLYLKNISLGYTFKDELISSIGLKELRVYVSTTNAYLWSKRKGMDPRTSLAGINNEAVYSPIRTFVGGVSIKL